MMTEAMMLAVAGVAFAAFGEWRPPEKFLFLAQGGNTLKEVAPEFAQIIPREIVRPRQLKNGRWTFPIDELRRPRHPDGSQDPFFVNLMMRSSLAPGMMFLAELDEKLPERYEAFRLNNPGFIGFETTEWVNDVRTQIWKAQHYDAKNFKERPDSRIRGKGVTRAEYEEFIRRPVFANALNSPGEWATNLQHWVFNRTVQMNFGAKDRMFVGDGQFCLDHLEADWGVGGLWMETSRNYYFWQNQLMCSRGAAAQYGIPFHWYIASCYTGYDAEGNCDPRKYGDQTADSPNTGISVSAVKRATYLSYLSGAASTQRENQGNTAVFHKGEKKGQLAPEGRMFIDFVRFVKANPDRGVPLRPVAVVMPRDRGYSRMGGKAFYNHFAYRRSDYLLDALMSVLLEYPVNRAPGLAKSGAERVMCNSRFGDIVDAIVPGGERPETFRRALANYQVVFLAGEFEFSAEDRAALEAFKAKGGTLIDVGELVDNFRDPRYAFANIFPAEYDFFSDLDIPADAPAPYQGFERLSAAVEAAVLPTHPFGVSGSVQFGFNRTKTGWLLYLIDNAGVVKTAREVEKIAPGGSEVTIDLKGFKASEVLELITGQAIRQSNNQTISITVPHGDVRVIRIRNGQS